MKTALHASVAPVAAPWEELARRTGAPPWLWPGWIDAWWRAFGRGRLELLTAERDGELVAVLPLVRQHVVRRPAANWHSPAFAPLAADGGALEAIARAAFAARPPVVTVRPVPGEGPAAGALRATAEQAGYRVVERVQMRSPYVELDGDFASFLKRRPPGASVLKDIRRCRRRLEDEGEVRFEVHDGSERLDVLLDEGYAVEAAGWQGEAGSAIASLPQTRAFYTEIAGWASEQGWLRLLFLRVGGRAVAFDYCLQYGGVLYDLKGGYRTEYRKQGPGKMLALEAIEWAYGQGLRELDFLGDDDDYKLQWTERVRERSVMRFFSPSPAGAAARATWVHGRPAADRALAAARRVARR
jgi:CelD/BcsL family acetyltransferase involved in cellulose biosynthesis